MWTEDDFDIAYRAMRARYHRSPRSRRDWVLYVRDTETLRRVARGESLI